MREQSCAVREIFHEILAGCSEKADPRGPKGPRGGPGGTPPRKRVRGGAGQGRRIDKGAFPR